MKNEEKDLLPRTKMFAFKLQPLTTEAKELVAIFIAIVKKARRHA